MLQLNDFLSLPIFQNSAAEWMLAGATTTIAFFTLLLARRLIRDYHERLLSTEKVEFTEIPMEALSRTSILFILVLAIFIGLNTLSRSAQTGLIIESALTVILFWQMGLWGAAGTKAWIDRKRRSSVESDRAALGSLGIVGFIARAIIWTLVVLLALDNLGINITALVAGLGIGGVAVALALQNVLGDLFASLSIALDKPFFVGDFVVFDDFMGSVDNIGIRSTRLRSLSGEQIIASNADLLKSRLRNYGRMSERRVVFSFGVVYETTADQLEKIPSLIRDIINTQQNVRFDRSHFARHGEASLDFETVYYVLSADYNRYMDTHQAIILKIHREFERRDIQFAYPTQRLLLERSPTHLAQKELQEAR
ncbi:MAG: mechanosensitive ion channel family protein [Betaproteobacteria bacterium]